MGDPCTTPQPSPEQQDRAVTALQDVFSPTLDWSTPCGHRVVRPRHLEGRTVQHRKAGDLWCNRPLNHHGPHRVYSDDFHVLAERPR